MHQRSGFEQNIYIYIQIYISAHSDRNIDLEYQTNRLTSPCMIPARLAFIGNATR